VLTRPQRYRSSRVCPLPDRWYLRLTCERFGDGRQIFANGSLVYGPGRGTSIARCPHNTEIVGTAIAYL
jgi:hypothetical protein